jgi:hypothetical protein
MWNCGQTPDPRSPRPTCGTSDPAYLVEYFGPFPTAGRVSTPSHTYPRSSHPYNDDNSPRAAVTRSRKVWSRES